MHTQPLEQNGTHLHEGDGTSEAGEEDEVNGNLLETDAEGHGGMTEGNLNQQYEKVKVIKRCCPQIPCGGRVKSQSLTTTENKGFPCPSLMSSINY